MDIMKILCIVFKETKGFVIEMKKEEDRGRVFKVEDYWATAKKHLLKVEFLSDLLNYDRDNIPQDIIDIITPE